MWSRAWLLALLFLPVSARALSVSPRSLRIEDSRSGNVLLGSDQATIERGELYKTVVLLWGNLDVSGEVDKVILVSGHVKFHPGAKLKSSLVVMGGDFEVDSGADVPAANIVAEVPGPAWQALRTIGALWRGNADWVTTVVSAVVTSLMSWLLAWALFHVFPSLQAATEGSLARQWPKNLAVGVLGSVGTFVVLALLVISIIGILAIPVYFLLLLFSFFVSYLAAALWAGHRLLPPKEGRRLNPLGFLLGILALRFLWAVPVWWAHIPVLVLWTIAWGALVRATAKVWL